MPFVAPRLASLTQRPEAATISLKILHHSKKFSLRQRVMSRRDMLNPSSVLEYVKTTPYASWDVRRINLGTTNFTFRLFLNKPYGEKQAHTAILKHAAPYLAEDPDVAFSQDRLFYEARALNFEPLHELAKDGQLPNLSVPTLYLYDSNASVIIMEDVSSCRLLGTNIDSWDETMHSAREFFETSSMKAENKMQNAKLIGARLGSLLTKLHDWAFQRGNAVTSAQLFEGNVSARDVTIQTTFRDFLPAIDSIGFKLRNHERRDLEASLISMEKLIERKLDTVTMGDFW